MFNFSTEWKYPAIIFFSIRSIVKIETHHRIGIRWEIFFSIFFSRRQSNKKDASRRSSRARYFQFAGAKNAHREFRFRPHLGCAAFSVQRGSFLSHRPDAPRANALYLALPLFLFLHPFVLSLFLPLIAGALPAFQKFR